MNARALLLLALLVAGCKAAAPAASLSARPVTPAAIGQAGQKPAAPLVHDGGIVFGPRLAPIADAGRREAASRLGTALSVSLLVERSLRDAALLAGNAPSAYALLAEEEEDWADAIATGDVLDAIFGQGTADDLAAIQRAGEDALAEWEHVADSDRSRLEALVALQEGKLLASLETLLDRKRRVLARMGEDRVRAIAGGQEVTTTYAVDNAGKRTLTTTRALSDAGTAIRTTSRLEGTLHGLEVASERVRTLRPDGTVEVATETRYRLDGETEVVSWRRLIGEDGAISATGTLARGDGPALSLSAGGSEAGKESYRGLAGEVRVEFSADAGAERATAVFEEGGEPRATLEVDGDADL